MGLIETIVVFECLENYIKGGMTNGLIETIVVFEFVILAVYSVASAVINRNNSCI